jgi:acetyltransferase-like isoleucine patch superfamily enzyme
MDIAFHSDSPSQLIAHGIELNLRNTMHVCDAVAFEPPCVVHCKMDLSGALRVGAFTGIYGAHGQLRHAHVGRYCSIAPDVQIGWDQHPTTRLSSSMLSYARNIHGWAIFCGVEEPPLIAYHENAVITEIGHDVWIGHGAFLRKGIRVGTGAVIGAGSVVVKDVPPYAIVAGNPARVIRLRFAEPVIADLLRSEWWRYRLFDMPKEVIEHPHLLPEWLKNAALKPYEPEWVRNQKLHEIIM